jgi:hypothetical protein
MTLHDQLRHHLGLLTETLAALDAAVEADGGELPVLLLARLLLAVDAASCELGKHAEALATLQRKGSARGAMHRSSS